MSKASSAAASSRLCLPCEILDVKMRIARRHPDVSIVNREKKTTCRGIGNNIDVHRANEGGSLC